MKRALIAAALLALPCRYAQAQDDAGAADAGAVAAATDAGAPGSASDAGPVAMTADGGIGVYQLVPEVADDVNLAGGSELAAGVDPNAGQEIVHPGNMASLQAGLRTIGSVFQGGSGSVAIEFNPYLVLAGRDMTYHDVTRVHDRWYGRFLTDLSTSLAFAAGSPFATDDQSRFSTLGLGVAVDLLGERSVYSPGYDECLNGNEAQEKRVRLIFRTLPAGRAQHKPGETDDQYAARLKEFLHDHPEYATTADPSEFVNEEKLLVQRCRTKIEHSTSAVYFSAGGRWVTPGSNRASGDAVVRVQREFVALAGEAHLADGVLATAQARLLVQRPAQADVMRTSVDAGGALQWVTKSASLTAELVQSFAELGGSAGDGSVAGTLKIALPSQLILNVGVQGKGTDVGAAFHRIAGTVTVSYKDNPVATQSFDLSKFK